MVATPGGSLVARLTVHGKGSENASTYFGDIKTRRKAVVVQSEVVCFVGC